MILCEIILSKLVDLSYICALYYSSTTLQIVNISSLYGIIYKLRGHFPFINFYYFLMQLMIKWVPDLHQQKRDPVLFIWSWGFCSEGSEFFNLYSFSHVYILHFPKNFVQFYELQLVIFWLFLFYGYSSAQDLSKYDS